MRALCRLIATGAALLATAMPMTLPAAANSEADTSGLRPASVPLVILQNRDGRMEEFWIGSDCHLWHRWQRSDGSWSGPDDLKGCAVGYADGEINADGRLEIFIRGTDNRLWHIWQLAPGIGWSPWQSLDGILWGEPFSGYYSDNHALFVQVRGVNNVWYQNEQRQPNCCWTGWFPAN